MPERREVLRIGPSGPNHWWWVTKTVSASRHVSSERVRWRWGGVYTGVSEKQMNIFSMVTKRLQLNKMSAKMFGCQFYSHIFAFIPIQPFSALFSPTQLHHPVKISGKDMGRSSPLKECPQKKQVFLYSRLLAPILLLPLLVRQVQNPFTVVLPSTMPEDVRF